MNGVTFMVWSAVMLLALAFWFLVFDSVMATIVTATSSSIGQVFALFSTAFLLMAIVGWVNASYDLFTEGRERWKARKRWPY